MNKFYRRIIYKNGYLLIIAAWLYTLSFVVGNYFNYNNTPVQVKHTLEDYLKNQEQGFENVTNNLGLFTTLVSKKADKSNLNLYESPTGIFIYRLEKDSVFERVFWSRFDREVYPEELKYPDGYYFSNHTNGYYEFLKKTIRLDSNIFVATALIPIKSNYFVENNYLKNTFNVDEKISEYYDISFESGLPVLNSKGKPLFNIERIDGSAKTMPVWEAILKMIAIFCCLIFLNYCIIEITEKKGFKKGLILLLSSLILIRLLSYFFKFPFYFRQFELFSPTIFSSSILHPSLGAVVINSLLFLWITKFIRYQFNFSEKLFKDRESERIFGYSSLVVFILFSYYLFNLINTLVVDSNIPFTVINFFELNVYTLVGFFVIAVIILIYYNLTYVLLSFTQRAGINVWHQLMVVLITSLIVIFLIPNKFSDYFKIGIVIWLSGYIFFINYHLKDVKSRLIRSPYFLFWIIFYAFSATFLMLDNDDFEKAKVENIIENLIYKSVDIDENLISLSTSEINDDFLQKNFYRFRDSAQNHFLKDSLIENNLSAYLNTFDVNLLTYDSSGNALFNNKPFEHFLLDKKIQEEGIELNVKDLYYIESDTGNNAFIYRKIVNNTIDSSLGYFYLILSVKNFQTNNLYNQLLSSDNSVQSLYGSYYIGFYKNGRIINETSLYNFPDTINNAELKEGVMQIVNRFSGDQYWYKVNDNKTIVVVDKESFIYEYISLFSYLLGFSVLFILLINSFYYLIEARFKWKNIKTNLQLSLRTRIYTTIIFVSLFSLIIIGGSTISVNILSYERDNQSRLGRVIRRFTKEIEFDLNTKFPENYNPKNDTQIKEFVTDELLKLAQVSSENLNFYSTNGNIIATSQPYIYNRKILSNQMNPVAYNQLHFSGKKEFFHIENINDFKYLSGYAPINFDNKNIGYINIPFLNVQSQLDASISSFITTIICIIALVFILAGLLSMVLTQRILYSLTIIKNQMQKINLGEENTEIDWKKNDEIGDVIDEYNKMLRTLKASANQLARTEREGAWSEMARQVAHEIKNPLTPMKLNLQFLKRLSEKNDPESMEQAKRISESLIEQIDQLALIASDFSQFANIGQVRPEVFNVSEIIEKLIDIYSVNNDIKIIYKKTGIDTIYFDKIQIHRLFSNLIKNAIEASTKHPAKLEITIQDFGDNVVVSVRDNGVGIKSEQAAKIFVPNFTTKSSGTGLGLAISKVIVENAKGRIWFESIPNIGTTFYVSLPLMK